MSPVCLSLPASSANLGPGFDSMGLALDLYLECRFATADNLTIVASGCDSAAIPCDPTNLIWKTAQTIAAAQQQILPFIYLEIRNQIPLGKGLGSSAAALTAGVVIASHILELKWDRRRIFEEAARLEGHPDNVAACVMGGVTASAIDEGGRAHAVSLPLPTSVEVAVVTPDFILPTEKARAALPECYSRQDAIFNIQRTALLVAGIASGDTTVFPCALGDRLHHPYREALVPGLQEILQLRAPGLLGCALSGAGPSVLVFHEQGASSVCDRVHAIFASYGRVSECLARGVAPGYSLTSE
jgi:homoserine kinase